MENIEKDILQLKTDVAEIKLAIIGNEKYKQDGLVKKIDDIKSSIGEHDVRIKKLEDDNFKKHAISAGITAGASFAGGYGLKAILAKMGIHI